MMRLVRRVPILRKFALERAIKAREQKRQKDWAYVQSVLATVGLITINWAGIERLLDELIASYQHSHTDLSCKHPRMLSSKLDYLKMMERDDRLHTKTREFLRDTRITAKRLGDNRHDIIHGLLHRVPGQHSITWRTQRIIYEGPTARAVEREYHNKTLADIGAEIADFSNWISPKVWVMTRTDYSVFPASEIEKALDELGMV